MMDLVRPLTEAEAKHMRELLRSAAQRREHKQFVIEGEHLLEVAIEKRAKLEYCAFTEDARQASDLFERAQRAGIAVRMLPAKLARRISDTESPQGIFAVATLRETAAASGPLILALDAVQDPGNLGTLLRTAAWFGVRSVLLGEGSADAYNAKVIRATQGAIFTLQIEERVPLATELRKLRNAGYTAVATVLDERAQRIEAVPRPERVIVVLGNEAHGIGRDVREACDSTLYIPRVGEGESLNVAATGAILLYHFTRPL